jgi:ArsR family transcriptional regulator, arsenate/arsenite/antimonite-responsive transcriptional repressor
LQYKNILVGVSKTEHFTAEQNDMALVTKALGHPARIAIIEYLINAETCICGDIVNHLPLAQPTVSQHLKELKNADLIKGNIEGNAICYCINQNKINQIINYFSKTITALKSKSCC